MDDNELSQAEDRWEESDSQHFIDYGRYYVPDREVQLDIMSSLLRPQNDPFHVLELACGEGLLAETILDRYPEAIVHGLDASPLMLEQASHRLERFGDRFQAGLFELEASGWRKPEFPVGAVVSSLAVHHLELGPKQRLFQDLHASLIHGGQLVIADLVLPAGDRSNRLAAAQWDEIVRQRALALDGDESVFQEFEKNQWNYFRYPQDPLDHPTRLFDQLVWLEQAGFVDVDVYWMKAGHAIFGGEKAA